MHEIRIREAVAGDADTIAEFNRRLAAETEGRKLDEGKLSAGVTALLNDPSHGVYYIAELDGAIVGQLLITYEWSDWRNGRFWWIQSVYVPKPHRRKGIFTTLYCHVRKLAEESESVCGIRLHVEADNDVAQSTYAALGMSPHTYKLMEQEL